MLKTKETTIDGKNFKVTQLGYSDGIELLTKLLSIAGMAFDNGAGKESFSLGRLAANLKANDLKSVIEKLANRTLIERESGSDKWPKLEPEIDLAGDYSLMVRWLKFALEVKLRRFFFRRGYSKKRRFTRSHKEVSSSIVPPDIPWRVYRVAMSKYFSVSPIEIEEQWSIDDVDYA